MSRSIWSGALSFGLVNVEVTLHTATHSRSLQFHLLNKDDRHPVQYQKVDANDGKALDAGDLVKGYEFQKGQYVVLEEQDFDTAEIKTGRNINILNFVKIDELDPIYFQKAYYLAPTKISTKAYSLLLKVLRDDNLAAIANFVLRNKQHLCAVRAWQNVMVLETMYYSDEVIQPDELIEEAEPTVNKDEVELARILVDKLSSNFDPARYKDEYRENLQKIIDAKIQGEEITVPEVPQSKPVVDIMSALKESIEKAKKEAA